MEPSHADRMFRSAAFVAALLLANQACVHPTLPPIDPTATLRVRVTLEGNEDADLRTFVAQNVRVSPWPALPRASMPLVGTGTGMVAVATGRARKSIMFVVHESSTFRPTLTVFAVSPRQAGDKTTIAEPNEPSPPPTAPCESWSAFFVKGVGDRPDGAVRLSRWQNGGPSRSMSVDPARHTLELPPVLHFSTRDVRSLRDRKATLILGIRATAGTTPFLILGLVKKPDGSLTEAAFVPGPNEQGWGGFVHRPGETTEITFYALGVPPAGACREMAM